MFDGRKRQIKMWIVISTTTEPDDITGKISGHLSQISVFGPFTSKEDADSWIETRKYTGFRYMRKFVNGIPKISP